MPSAECTEQTACTNVAAKIEANNNEILDDFDGKVSTVHGTPIQQFYANQTVLITGATGFLGKILLEKLLRSCSDISRIYTLIRSKKGKNAQSRMEELLQDRLYDRLRNEVPNFSEKITAVNGDCAIEGLDLSESDRELLEREVSIVFHVAATVRFDETLKFATAINIGSTAEILKMCKRMRKLKCFIHVSTAYANCILSEIKENFYDYPINHREVMALVNNLPESTLEEITPRIIGKWPNTYTFTKALAENLIRQENDGLPIGIFRPAVVVSTLSEPVSGWVDNTYGATGIVAGTAAGVIRVILLDKNVYANVVPVDITVNALIASAWDVYVQKQRRNEDMLIYNFVSSTDAPLTWLEFYRKNHQFMNQHPLSFCLWYPTLTMVTNKIVHDIIALFFHLIPAFILDSVNVCLGRKPRLWKMYEKVQRMSGVLTHFTMQEWRFTNDNVEAMWIRLHEKDRQLFNFNMKGFNWTKYFENYLMGIRMYLFNEDSSTLEMSKRKFKRLYWLHQSFRTIFFLFGSWIIWKIFAAVFQ